MSTVNEVAKKSQGIAIQATGNEVRFGPHKRAFLAKKSFQVSDPDVWDDQAFWEQAILSLDVVPLPIVHEIEDTSTEATIDEGLFEKYEVDAGKISFEDIFRLDPHIANQMQGLNAQDWELLLINVMKDGTRALRFTTDKDCTTFNGFPLSDLTVSKRKLSAGDTLDSTGVSFTLEDETSLSEREQYTLISSFNILALKALTEVRVTATGTPTTAELKLLVRKTIGGLGISGLVTADFIVLDPAGVEEVFTVVDDGEGNYTLTFLPILSSGDHTANIRLPEVTTVDVLSEIVAKFTV